MAIDARALPTPSPDEAAEVITDPHRRKRLLQLAMVMTTIDGNVDRGPVERVAGLARALGISLRTLKTLHKMASHHDTMARFDLVRQVGGRMVELAWRDERWAGVRKVLTGMRSAEVPEVFRRYNRLGLLLEGTFLFFGIAQFHLGMKITPIADAETGYLDVDKVMTALARGASCKVDLSDNWDIWPYARRPLEEVRAELGIPPLA